MENNELNENQFKMIKKLCRSLAMIVFCPHTLNNDDDKIKTTFAQNLTDLQALERAGFVKNVNQNFEEQLEHAKLIGARTFDAFGVTERAYQMFLPPEGLVN